MTTNNNDKEKFKSDENSVYVRGLPWKATEEEIREFFKDCGDIAKLEMPLDDQGRSSGTAIIEFDSSDAAAKALDLDQATFGERWLSVKPSTRAVKPEGCTTVFCGNLSFDIDEDSLRDFFKDCGNIKEVRFSTDRETGDFKGFGHVEFEESDSAENAVKLAGQFVMDRKIRIDYAQSKKREFGDSFGGGRGRGGRSSRGGGGRGYMNGGGRGGRGGRGGGRGGGRESSFGNKKTGGIAAFSGNKITFD
jgi:nucleolin